MNTLVGNLNKEVINLLKDCEVASGMKKLKSQNQKSTWMVASGGDQEELRFLFKEKKITSYFEAAFMEVLLLNHQISRLRLNKNFTSIISWRLFVRYSDSPKI